MVEKTVSDAFFAVWEFTQITSHETMFALGSGAKYRRGTLLSAYQMQHGRLISLKLMQRK